MLLAHARARAHTLIYRSSAPDVTFHKTAVVTNADAEDWEPIQTDPNYQPPVVNEDCGCPQAATDEEADDVNS